MMRISLQGWLVAGIALIAVLGFAWKASAQDDASLQRMLTARIQARLDAFASGNPAPWKSDMDPNALIVDEEGNVRTPSVFLAWLTPLPKGSTGQIWITEPHFSRNNDVIAIAYIARERESIYNAHFAARFSVVDTYHEHNGEWLLISEQQTRLQMDPPTVTLTPSHLQAYVGRYRMEGAPYVFAVSIKDGHLVGGTEGRPSFAISAIADQPNMFFRPAHPALYIFLLRNGRATELIDRRYYNHDARYKRI